VPGKTDVSEKRALLAKLAESKPSPNSFGRRARFSATNTERPNSQSVRNSDNDPSTMIYWVCVPLLAAQRIARRDDSHCSLLNDRRPWEASSAVLDYGSPFLRREQWHTMSITFSRRCATAFTRMQ
jgi:hypothetical protein